MPDIEPSWHRFNGYGYQGYGDNITGSWDCVFTFAEIDPAPLVDNVNLRGLLIYKGPYLQDKRFACLQDGEFKVYKKLLK